MIRTLTRRLRLAHRLQAQRRSTSDDTHERDDAIHADASLAAAYASCRSYLTAHDGVWGLIKYALPPGLAPHVDAVFAFTVYADDLVDDPGSSPEQRALRFHEWRDLVLAVQDGYMHPGHLDWSLCRAFAHTMTTRVSEHSAVGFLDAMESDLAFSGFRTYAELERYMDRVAGDPALWVNALFEGVTPDALRKCCALAAAWEITDLLVDLDADLARGRLALPLEDLERFQVDREELELAATRGHTPDRIRALVLFEAARARALQETSAGWGLLVAPAARAAAEIMESGWQQRLTRIERSGGDLFGEPPRIQSSHRAAGRGSLARPQPSRHVAGRPGAGDGGGRRGPAALRAAPRHIGIITDGNRRWAQERGVPVRAGHVRGAQTLRTIGLRLLDRDRYHGLEYLSVYGFSTENWGRAPEELNDLFDIYAKFAREHVRDLAKLNVRVRFMGRPDGLPDYVLEAIDIAEGYTADNDGGTLAICLNYGGQTEITDAMTAMLASASTSPAEISTQTLTEFLYAPDIPALDLVIRTGGEQRLSNFMLWRAAYAELVFVPTLWPDFTTDELEVVLDDYAMRTRRFGS